MLQDILDVITEEKRQRLHYLNPNFRQTLIRSLQTWLCKRKYPDQQVDVKLVQVRSKNNL